MRIGIDFDNTIACYDGVFHAAAVERGLIPAGMAGDRVGIRDHLRRLGRDADFTALQAHVYGTRMHEAELFPGLIEALAGAKDAGCDLFLVSHRTLHPYVGPALDLHAAARRFLERHGLVGGRDAAFASADIHFELTRAAKLARIATLRCNLFVDDLPEILAMQGFPAMTTPILLDPRGRYPGGRWENRSFETYASWTALGAALLDARGDRRGDGNR